MSNRTHSQSTIDGYQTQQTNSQNQFNNFYNSVLTLLKQRKNYMDAGTYATYMSQLTSLAKGLPSYITDIDSYTYWEWRGGFFW